jgi:hypothetical protein
MVASKYQAQSSACLWYLSVAPSTVIISPNETSGEQLGAGGGEFHFVGVG